VIYADNAATTKISDVAFEKMLPFLREQYGNPSSQYSLGVIGRRAIEQARQQIAGAIGAEPTEIVFTSGGSEANSWVLRSIAELFIGEEIHIITSCIEHHSVLNACHELEAKGIEVTYLPVDSCGLVSVSDVKEVIKPNTKLVSIMLANNEIGTVQPIVEIGQCLHEKGILFHSDAVQAVGHVALNVKNLSVDFLSASAHKFNGAKGTGFLYKRSGLDMRRLIYGGEQENGTRGGTENVAGIVAMNYALEESITDMPEVDKRMKTMIALTVEGIKRRIPNVRINGDSYIKLPGMVNLGFNGVAGESLMNLLDLKGICVSTSSACTSGRDEPSHVLMALGLTEQQAKSAIRISYGRYNTLQDVESIIVAICTAYNKILGADANCL